MKKLHSFTYNGVTLTTKFIESLKVTKGVTCDVYIHPETNKRDLGIIFIQPGNKTPLQKVLSGDKTIEGLISGKGTLTIVQNDGSKVIHQVNSDDGVEFSRVVNVGEIMQWEASTDSALIAFEICYPPYKDGRYENIKEKS